MARVSVAADDTQADNFSDGPSVSAEGRFVAFHSAATNLVPGDTNSNSDVFVRDRVAGTTERVSVAADGVQADDIARPVNLNADLSGDGRFVAFGSFASNLVPGDTNGTADVFVAERIEGSATATPTTTATVPAAGRGQRPRPSLA